MKDNSDIEDNIEVEMGSVKDSNGIYQKLSVNENTASET